MGMIKKIWHTIVSMSRIGSNMYKTPLYSSWKYNSHYKKLKRQLHWKKQTSSTNLLAENCCKQKLEVQTKCNFWPADRENGTICCQTGKAAVGKKISTVTYMHTFEI